jgi:hypothetical protein
MVKKLGNFPISVLAMLHNCSRVSLMLTWPGSQITRCDASRSLFVSRAALLFRAPVLAARLVSRKAHGFAPAGTRLPGQSCRRHYREVVAAVNNLPAWRPLMAKTSLCPATAGVSSHLAAASTSAAPADSAQRISLANPYVDMPEGNAALQDVLIDAQCACVTLTTIVELLRGCAAGHQITAVGMLRLLEPVAGSLDTLCGDLGTVANLANTH